MTLDQLVLLQELNRLGSVRAVSEVLHKTPSAISQSLKLLEQQLEVELFDRNHYRLTLSPQGMRICQQAEKALAEVEHIRQLSQHLSAGYEGDICLSFDGAYDISQLKSGLQTIQNQFPDTRIHLQQEYLTGAIEALHNNSADLAISPTTPLLINEQIMEIKPLMTQELINLASPELLAKFSQLTHSQQLKNAYQVVVKDSGTLTQQQEFGVPQGQRKWYVNDYETKKALILNGLGWGKLPVHLVTDELQSGHLVELFLDDYASRLSFEISLLRLKRPFYGKVCQAFWQVF